MAAEQLVFEYSRTVDAAASPAGVVHYYTNDAQAFCIKSGQQATENSQVDAGDWSDYDALAALPNSPASFSEMRLDHPSFGAIFGITSDMMFHLYLYAADISDLVDTMEITEQADNQIKGLAFNLKNTANVLFESDASLFQPGAAIYVALTMGDNDDYFEMGNFYLDSSPFDPFAASLSYQGRSRLGRLKDSTFDVNAAGSYTAAVFTGTCGKISIDILTDYSGGEITVANIITNLVTEHTATFQPNDNVLEKFNAWLAYIGWAMVDLGDGRYVVGPPVELISLYRKNNRYTFTRDQDIFTRRIDKSGDGAYSRVCVKYGNPAAYTIRDVPMHDYWYIPFHKTYHINAPDGADLTAAQLLAENTAAKLQYIGIREQCVGLIRPWLIIGDVAQLSEGGVTTVTGVITEIKHQMGAQGFFTTFVTDSGGEILADDGTDLTVAIASSVWGENRQRRITDFIKKG